MRAPQLRCVRELEDLLIDCIYQGLLSGRLDQKEGHLEVFSCAGRDVHPEEVPRMAATLVEWQRHAGELMAEVSTQIASFKRQQDDARKAQRELDDKVERLDGKVERLLSHFARLEAKLTENGTSEPQPQPQPEGW